MPAIREIEWEPCLLERLPNPELEKRFQRATGRPGRMMQFFEGCPWLADAIVRLSVQVQTHVTVEANLSDQIGLVISQDNSCRFCFGAQRAFLRVMGMPETRIARLEQDHLTGDFSQSERAAFDFVRRISRSRPLVSAAETAALTSNGFATLQIRELVGQSALHLFFNRISTLGALPPAALERFPDHWAVRFLRPLMAFKFRRMSFVASQSHLPEVEKNGICGPIVDALDGLPMAHEWHLVLSAMWQSGPLPARTVSLIFAVIARALGSQRCEQEARRMLEPEGLNEFAVDQILAHLASPQFSEIEAVLVPFARETVWYQPAQIQRRCEEVQHEVGRAAFLHFLGIVSVVNAICRIGFVADLD